MRIDDLIIMSMRSLWRRKLRTGLTVLGVIIGASSIILMLSLGVAMDQSFKNQMGSMSSLTIVDVYAGYYGENSDAAKLDKKGLEALQAIPGVEVVIPERTLSANLLFGKYKTPWEVRLVGLSTEEYKALGYDLEYGEPFQDKDNAVLLGYDILTQFSKNGKELPWGEELQPFNFKIGQDKVKIDIGRYDWETGQPATNAQGEAVQVPTKEKATVLGTFSKTDYNTAYIGILPIELYEEINEAKRDYEKKLYGEVREEADVYQSVKVKVTSEKEVLDVMQMIKDSGYQAYSPIEMLKQMEQTSMLIQLMLGGIGSISLLVAAIGIANTMMMAIYERTKEIGIMKVIGARVSDIKKMFLVEALMIGATGGLVGVLGSYAVSALINKVGAGMMGNMGTEMSTGAISIIPPWLALTGFLFSAVIGLIAGYLPAKRAMQLSALSAIKTD